jgi:predicted oxidoreductase
VTRQTVCARISPVGFGTYRWTGAPDHVAALHRALDLGCTLVDTAPNYATLEVRSLLGRVLAPHRADVHLISKGGYTSEGGYSLEPRFIRDRIRSEAELVGDGYLDTFLLHNPEHLLVAFDERQVLDQVGEALAVCAEQVAAGTIRSFGVSSNVVATPSVAMGQDTVYAYAQLAADLNAGHALRYLQFPHNLVERAALSDHWLDRCRALKLTTIGNRPLSPLTPHGPFRIADPPMQPHRPSIHVLAELGRRRHGLSWLQEHWDQVASPDALDYVEGLVELALKDPASAAVAPTVRELISAKRLEFREAASAQTSKIVESPEIGTALVGDPGRPVALRACETYLRDLDHVLVGFRRPADVDQLGGLFQSRLVPG